MTLNGKMGSKKRAEKLVKKPVKKGRQKLKPMDGLGPYEKKKIRNAVRQVWHRSLARKLCVERAKDKSGFHVCEKCGRRNPNNKIDHIHKVGEVDSGFIGRMFVPADFLQALCKKCHDLKTKEENAAAKKAADAKLDFY